MQERPGVGVSVVVIRDGRVLFGKRKGMHEPETWGPPGGHIELYEIWQDAARREVGEETGITVGPVRFGAVTNDIFESGKHYITIFGITEWVAGEAEVKEPTKCSEWRWVLWNELPTPLFLPVIHFLESGCNPFIT